MRHDSGLQDEERFIIFYSKETLVFLKKIEPKNMVSFFTCLTGLNKMYNLHFNVFDIINRQYKF